MAATVKKEGGLKLIVRVGPGGATAAPAVAPSPNGGASATPTRTPAATARAHVSTPISTTPAASSAPIAFAPIPMASLAASSPVLSATTPSAKALHAPAPRTPTSFLSLPPVALPSNSQSPAPPSESKRRKPPTEPATTTTTTTTATASALKRPKLEEPAEEPCTAQDSEQWRRALKPMLEQMHTYMTNKDSRDFFAAPVTDAIAPLYSQIIKHPMDFGTMRGKIEKGVYRTIEEYEADLRLVLDNCMRYNTEDTVFHKEAARMAKLVPGLVKKFQGMFEREVKRLSLSKATSGGGEATPTPAPKKREKRRDADTSICPWPAPSPDAIRAMHVQCVQAEREAREAMALLLPNSALGVPVMTSSGPALSVLDGPHGRDTLLPISREPLLSTPLPPAPLFNIESRLIMRYPGYNWNPPFSSTPSYLSSLPSSAPYSLSSTPPPAAAAMSDESIVSVYGDREGEAFFKSMRTFAAGLGNLADLYVSNLQSNVTHGSHAHLDPEHAQAVAAAHDLYQKRLGQTAGYLEALHAGLDDRLRIPGRVEPPTPDEQLLAKHIIQHLQLLASVPSVPQQNRPQPAPSGAAAAKPAAPAPAAPSASATATSTSVGKDGPTAASAPASGSAPAPNASATTTASMATTTASPLNTVPAPAHPSSASAPGPTAALNADTPASVVSINSSPAAMSSAATPIAAATATSTGTQQPSTAAPVLSGTGAHSAPLANEGHGVGDSALALGIPGNVNAAANVASDAPARDIAESGGMPTAGTGPSGVAGSVPATGDTSSSSSSYFPAASLPADGAETVPNDDALSLLLEEIVSGAGEPSLSAAPSYLFSGSSSNAGGAPLATLYGAAGPATGTGAHGVDVDKNSGGGDGKGGGSEGGGAHLGSNTVPDDAPLSPSFFQVQELASATNLAAPSSAANVHSSLPSASAAIAPQPSFDGSRGTGMDSALTAEDICGDGQGAAEETEADGGAGGGEDDSSSSCSSSGGEGESAVAGEGDGVEEGGDSASGAMEGVQGMQSENGGGGGDGDDDSSTSSSTTSSSSGSSRGGGRGSGGGGGVDGEGGVGMEEKDEAGLGGGDEERWDGKEEIGGDEGATPMAE